MTLKAQILEDMKNTMKAGDKDRLKVLRLILAAIQQIEIDKRIDLGDTDVLGVLKKMIKQRYDSVSLFKKGNRMDLANIELAEIAVLETYLPEQLSEAELMIFPMSRMFAPPLSVITWSMILLSSASLSCSGR